MNTAKFIYDRLSASTAVTALVGQRMYPLVTLSTDAPYIVYSRDSVDPLYDKGGLLHFDCRCSVNIVAETYDQSMTLADAVVGALTDATSASVQYCRLVSVVEDFQNDYYVQILTFEIIEKWQQ